MKTIVIKLNSLVESNIEQAIQTKIDEQATLNYYLIDFEMILEGSTNVIITMIFQKNILNN